MRTVEIGSPLLLYEWKARKKLRDTKKNLEYESRKKVANVLRIVLLGSQVV